MDCQDFLLTVSTRRASLRTEYFSLCFHDFEFRAHRNALERGIMKCKDKMFHQIVSMPNTLMPRVYAIDAL